MKERILEVARKEFVEKGFLDASMRNIASEIGITATALYRHYSNKEEIFEAVVAPAVKDWERLCDSESEKQTSIGRNEGLEAMWQGFSLKVGENTLDFRKADITGRYVGI